MSDEEGSPVAAEEAEEEYTVEKVVEKRIGKSGKIEYLLKWKGSVAFQCFCLQPFMFLIVLPHY
jgi:hypothetical protein